MDVPFIKHQFILQGRRSVPAKPSQPACRRRVVVGIEEPQEDGSGIGIIIIIIIQQRIVDLPILKTAAA
jgi:hypothetical protein